MIFAIILLLVIASANARWSQPLNISNGNVSHAEAYHNLQTYTTHLIWCDQTATMLLYRRLNIAGNLSLPFTLLSSSACSSSFIIGRKDGNKLYVLATGARRGMVSEVYFMQSEDSGLTWSKPISIGDNNTNIPRKAVGILVSEKTNRLWIFYTIGRSIYFATKSNDSEKDWKKDLLVYNSKVRNIIGIPAVHISNDVISVIWHEVLKDISGFLVQTTSSNFGLLWNSPVVIETTNITLEEEYKSSLSGEESNVYLGYHSYEDLQAFLRISKDNGMTWTEAIITTKGKAGAAVSLSSCGSTILSLSKTDKGLEFAYIDTKNSVVTFKEGPLENPEGVIVKRLHCFNEKGSIIGQALLDRNHSEIFISKYLD